MEGMDSFFAHRVICSLTSLRSFPATKNLAAANAALLRFLIAASNPSDSITKAKRGLNPSLLLVDGDGFEPS